MSVFSFSAISENYRNIPLQSVVKHVWRITYFKKIRIQELWNYMKSFEAKFLKITFYKQPCVKYTIFPGLIKLFQMPTNVLFWWQFFERLSFFYKKFCNMYLKIGAEVRIGNCLAIITFLYSTHNILWLVLSWINQVISHTKPFMAIYFLQLLHFVCDNQIKKSGNRLKLTQPHPFAFRAHNETKNCISWKEVQHFDMSSWN